LEKSLDLDCENGFSSALFGWMHALCQMLIYVLPHKIFTTCAKACDITRVLPHKFKTLVKSCFASRNIPFQKTLEFKHVINICYERQSLGLQGHVPSPQVWTID
jgi:hypothetical protein